MQDTTTQTAKSAAAVVERLPLRQRAVVWAQQAWRPAGTCVAVALILVFGWGVVNGKHGLSAWQQQRAKEKELHKEIQEVQDENAHLRNHVDRLKTDPGAIEHEAREQLHYAKPGEVIYALPPDPKTQPAPPANSVK